MTAIFVNSLIENDFFEKSSQLIDKGFVGLLLLLISSYKYIRDHL